jgi:peptidoglycan/xylan/chitin deacetylase (PgdA/CDA1 family)
MLGGFNSWDRNTGITEKPLMTIENWRSWLDAGMEVGSHTRTHADLSKLESDKAIEQIAASKRDLELALACEVRHFCYPYGRFTEIHRNAVQQSGYITGTTTHRGRISQADDPMTLSRVMVARSTNLLQFFIKIATRYEDKRA